MRPPSVDANPSCPAACPCHLLSLLHRPHRTALRLVMILLSHHGLSAAAIAELLGCDPGTVRRGSTATTPTAPAGWATGPELAGHRWAAPACTSAS